VEVGVAVAVGVTLGSGVGLAINGIAMGVTQAVANRARAVQNISARRGIYGLYWRNEFVSIL
jgi:hypothetical protein